MQQVTAAPRNLLTAAQVQALIEADAIEVDFGADLYTAAGIYLQDISADLLGGEVQRNNYRTIHGTARFQLSRQLVWGSQRIQPFMTLLEHASGVTARFNLGVYVMATPTDRAVGETPKTWDVDGFDKLAVLDTPIGSTYRVASGTGYLAAVATLIAAAGESAASVQIEQASAARTLPEDRVWAIDEHNTYLAVANELLDAVGYRGLWCDWDGKYRSEQYVSPAGRGAEWTYNAQAAGTIVAEDRESDDGVEIDTPNRWVFLRDDPSGAIPAAGAGLYVATNQSDGPSSIDARGRTITARPCPIRLDAVDDTALQAQGNRYVEEAKQQTRTFRLRSGPNPLHWHFDVVRLTDTDLGFDDIAVSQSWTLPLDGSDMSHEMKAVA